MTPRRKQVLKIAGAAIVAILVITSPLMIKAFRQRREFGRAFQKYYAAIQIGSYRTAYDAADGEFKKTISYEAFVKTHDSISTRYGSLLSVDQDNTVVEGKGSPMTWYARTNAKLRYQHGALDVKYYFRLTDGAWRLLGFEPRQ